MKWSPFFEPFDNVDAPRDQLPVASHAGLIPAIDIYDKNDSVVIETALPGVEKKHVKLSIENNILQISGTSERRTEIDEKDYYRKEIRSGSFMRQVALPNGIVQDQASADFQDGILTITFPKTALPGSTSITIDINS